MLATIHPSYVVHVIKNKGGVTAVAYCGKAFDLSACMDGGTQSWQRVCYRCENLSNGKAKQA